MKNPLIYVVIAIVIAFGAFLLFSNNTKQTETSLLETNVQNKKTENFTEKNSQVDTQQPSTSETKDSRYLTYTQAGFEAANDKKRVFFFHASWCPTCKAANQELTENTDKIPSNVIVFKTDYDSEKELKKQYGITYQHTFVSVDKDGKQVKKWNGGAIDELIANIQ